jgi:ribosomal protein S18 acetylase RimI-like enzyme
MAVKKKTELEIRQARPADALGIIQLYQEIYHGTYPDPRMSDFVGLERILSAPDYRWMVAALPTGEILASVVYQVDSANLLSKVFGAVVRPEHRGEGLAEKLMTTGLELLRAQKRPIEVVYATTRTVDVAPQKLTAGLDYRKLGIFPNIHRTEEYETHALTALLTPEALKKRYKGFKLHPVLAELYSIVRQETGLPDLPVLKEPPREALAGKKSPPFELETIAAPRFVAHRFHDEKPTVQEHHWFFPFLEPNLLLTTADQKVEVFAFRSELDRYCAIIGIRDAESIGYGPIFATACRELKKSGARYIEFIIRADEAAKIEHALSAQFVPCAYFPAMQLSAAGDRYDYVVFSRSYEILDFRNLRLEGVNRQYLIQYFNKWKELSLDPILLQ